MSRHHRHGVIYRIRRWIRHNAKVACGSLAIVVITLFVVTAVLYRSYQRQSAMHITAGNSVDMKDGYRTIEYNGQEYQYNNQLVTILYAEIDSEGKMQSSDMYGDNAKVDDLSLLLLDKKQKKISILTLDTQTIAPMHTFDDDGTDKGVISGILRDAYSYGDGGKTSCENLKNAVETLLDGITINEYVIANHSSKEQIKELADGLMEYIGELADKLHEDPMMLTEDAKIADEYLQTSITKSKYQSVAQAIDQTSEGIVNYYQLQGKTEQKEEKTIFCPDEQQLKQLVVELFYTAM